MRYNGHKRLKTPPARMRDYKADGLCKICPNRVQLSWQMFKPIQYVFIMHKSSYSYFVILYMLKSIISIHFFRAIQRLKNLQIKSLFFLVWDIKIISINTRLWQFYRILFRFSFINCICHSFPLYMYVNSCWY